MLVIKVNLAMNSWYVLWFMYPLRCSIESAHMCLVALTNTSPVPSPLFFNLKEFELCPSGKLRYANNSNYRDDSMIRKEVFVSPAVGEEMKRIIIDSQITTQVDDSNWKQPPLSSSSSSSSSNTTTKAYNEGSNNRSRKKKRQNDDHHQQQQQQQQQHHHQQPAARQELEIKLGNEHIAYTCYEISSLLDIQNSSDPAGLTIFYYLTQDLKCLVMSLINLHFKIRPIPT